MVEKRRREKSQHPTENSTMPGSNSHEVELGTSSKETPEEVEAAEAEKHNEESAQNQENSEDEEQQPEVDPKQKARLEKLAKLRAKIVRSDFLRALPRMLEPTIPSPRSLFVRLDRTNRKRLIGKKSTLNIKRTKRIRA